MIILIFKLFFYIINYKYLKNFKSLTKNKNLNIYNFLLTEKIYIIININI